MEISTSLCALAMRNLVGGACRAAGVAPGVAGAVEQVVSFLTYHFSDQSRKLVEALELTNLRSWRALEVALAGNSLWQRCRVLMASGEERAFREQVQPFLNACSLAELQGKEAFRQACLRELQAARKAGLLTTGSLEPAALARRAGTFARFSDPDGLVRADMEILEEMGGALREAGHPNLAGFVSLRPQQGEPLLVQAARYFFRRIVEEDRELFQGLAFARLEELKHGQDAAFDGLHKLLTEQSGRVEQVLAGIQETIVATHEAVLDIQLEQRRQGDQNRDLYQAVLQLQERLDLVHREVQPRDSLSIRSDIERTLVKNLIGRYRALSEERRQQLPALLNAIGKLEVAAGDFQAAQNDFTSLATIVVDPQAQAEAHANAYRAALERRDWNEALSRLGEAIRLDRARFAPFPIEKYQPRRILGAGGFGVAFLCRHRYLAADVVVKSLHHNDLDRDIDQVFSEAQHLRQLDHPAIIRLQDCGFGREIDESHPYLVMDYFEGVTLEDLVREKPLTPDELLVVARQVASGLQAAHGKGILHRDVKPANLLVRREGTSWQVKLIDFGLALRRTVRETQAANANTLTGSSIAGTLDYAAPEQMGKLPGVTAGPVSDIYGFGRTCCYALFQTPQPLGRHWRSLPPPLAELLESCLEERPEHRPRDFAVVLEQLDKLSPAPAPPPPPTVSPPTTKSARPTVPLPVTPPTPAPVVPPSPVARMTVEERQRELEQLAQEVSGCTSCSGLASTRTQTVFGAGPLDPEVCFLGEAPAGDEDRQGQPFVGASGQLLMDLLAEVGLRREEVYLGNMIKCRPPGNRTPQAAELSNCRSYLDRQIELIRPRFICTLGGTAAQALLGSPLSIGRQRGKFFEYKGIPVMCTYHPAFLLPGRSPEKRPQVIGDLQMLLRRMGRSVPGR